MCDTMVRVGHDGVLLAKNSDRDVNEAQVLTWSGAAEHPAGARVQCTWRDVAQVRRTHAVVLSRPWWMWGAEMGGNELGVVIGNEAVFTRNTGDDGTGELLGMDLLRLALERSRDRHEAVHTLVTMLERHGQGGSCSREHPRFSYDNSFIVADPAGAVVVETAGRHWATEEVGAARSVSNGLTIPGFAERYADPVRGRVAQCATRRARTEAAAAVAATPFDLMRALRDHGAPEPVYRPTNGALSAPCAHAGGLLTSTQTTGSWVADLRAGAPDGGRHWVTATAAPCTSLFKPVTVLDPVDVGAAAGQYDDSSLWWRHERLHRMVVRDQARLLETYRDQRDALERGWLADPPSGPLAFAEGERALHEWEDRVSAALGGADRRPSWVRCQWRSWDRAARMPGTRGRRQR